MNIFDLLATPDAQNDADFSIVAQKETVDSVSYLQSPKHRIYALAQLADEIDFYAEGPDGESTVRPA